MFKLVTNLLLNCNLSFVTIKSDSWLDKVLHDFPTRELIYKNFIIPLIVGLDVSDPDLHNRVWVLLQSVTFLLLSFFAITLLLHSWHGFLWGSSWMSILSCEQILRIVYSLAHVLVRSVICFEPFLIVLIGQGLIFIDKQCFWGLDLLILLLVIVELMHIYLHSLQPSVLKSIDFLFIAGILVSVFFIF